MNYPDPHAMAAARLLDMAVAEMSAAVSSLQVSKTSYAALIIEINEAISQMKMAEDAIREGRTS
jgi:hypothetical protein